MPGEHVLLACMHAHIRTMAALAASALLAGVGGGGAGTGVGAGASSAASVPSIVSCWSYFLHLALPYHTSHKAHPGHCPLLDTLKMYPVGDFRPSSAASPWAGAPSRTLPEAVGHPPQELLEHGG